MKKYIYLLALLFSLNGIAQVNENSWINYSQNYYKFPVAKDGIYKITYTDLLNSGIDVSAIDPRKLQVFGRGEEQYIYVQGENDGKIDVSDYIEFYAEHNDGKYDSTLYSTVTDHANPQYSMFTDTIFYYLTWSQLSTGKRIQIETDVNIGRLTKSSFYWNEVEVIQNSSFSDGALTIHNWAVPEYSSGEGWGSYTFKHGQTKTVSIAAPNVYGSGPNSTLYAGLNGRSTNSHSMKIYAEGVLLDNMSYSNYEMKHLQYNFSSSSVETQTAIDFVSGTSTGNINERNSLMYLSLRYPSTFDLGGVNEMLMGIPSGSNSKDYISVSNFNDQNSTVWLYDLTSHKKIVVQASGGIYDIVIPNNGIERKCLITSEAKARSVGTLSPVSGQSSLFTNYENLSIVAGGANYFIVSGSNLLSAANDYATYRNSKGFKSLVVDVEQLYDQYSFGIRKHPMAIRNFMLQSLHEWATPPENLLLLGKSVSARDARYASAFELNIVPTWSVLGSDVGFTNGDVGFTTLEPALGTGRIAATSNDQVLDYLAKVTDYESATREQWMKNVLHFGGGFDIGEQTVFKDYLKEYEDIIEGVSYGGKVHTFLKESSDPLQINLSDSVTTLINDGVSLFCFFGHANGTNFDQSIDEPENYDNTGRYGFVLANACLIGNIHTTGTSSGSERFVLTKDKGTIGFLGSSSLGVPVYLHQYTKSFYENLSTNNYGKSVGEIIRQVIIEIQNESDVFSRDVCMHMTLHGDPALVINAHAKPDYSLYGKEGLSQPQIYFSPSIVTNELDSFTVNAVITNVGRAQVDSFNIQFKRTFSDQQDTSYFVAVNNIYFRDTISVTLPVDILKGGGLNVFDIFIDPGLELDELSVLNNNATASLFIKSSEIAPVYPFEFAVVPNQHTVMKASTGDPFAPLSSYVFQIDTTDDFSSGILFEETIQSKGGVIEWDHTNSTGLKSFFNLQPSLTTLQAPVVFFWRVRPVLASGEELWKSSSYQHVSGKEGWGQSHFHQFKKNAFQFLEYDYNNRNYSFNEQVKLLEANCYYPVVNNATGKLTNYKIDGSNVNVWSRLDNDFLFVAVIDKVTLDPWDTKEHGNYLHPNFQDQYYTKGISDKNYYFFATIGTYIDSIVSLLNNVPDSNYILMYSFMSNNIPFWYNQGSGVGLDFKNTMQAMGADVDSMSNYVNNNSYIFFTQKGNPSKTQEAFSTGGNTIQLKAEMRNTTLSGKMTSTVVGPAQEWGSFHWSVLDGELSNDKDSNHIVLYAVDTTGLEIPVIDTLVFEGDVLDLSFVDAKQYPKMKISLSLSDDSLRTPKKLGRWQILFSEFPEAALNPLRISSFELNDSVQEGETFLFQMAIENIGKYDMDSMQVVHWKLDSKLNESGKTYRVLQALPVGGVIYDTVSVSTLSTVGGNSLWYDVNPYIGGRLWQNEQHHFNNISLVNFHVDKDKINPILDVTFDGIHILDGDIVSPKPFIVITLDDENQYLAIDDPSLIQVFLSYPNKEDSLVLLDESDYLFRSADFPKNKATIELTGSFPDDGTYKLRVMSQDRSSNISGKGDGLFDYSITFQVINKSSITQVMNWPNPFSTSTQFVFTLTGSVIPDNFLLQIMTISGKIVREVQKDEFGAINIGRNISDFKWDGKDKYGDQLANGVYLYRVTLKSDTEEFEERTSDVSDQSGTTSIKDRYFKKGIGKMYLLR